MKACFSIAGVNMDPERITNARSIMRGHVETVNLVPEPQNPHDARAIRVEVEGQMLGYLPKNAQPWLDVNLQSIYSTGCLAEVMEAGEIWRKEEGHYVYIKIAVEYHG